MQKRFIINFIFPARVGLEIREIGLEKVWKKFGILCAWLAANPVYM